MNVQPKLKSEKLLPHTVAVVPNIPHHETALMFLDKVLHFYNKLLKLRHTNHLIVIVSYLVSFVNYKIKFVNYGTMQRADYYMSAPCIFFSRDYNYTTDTK